MSWFFLALIGPLLYAATNHIDKYLISRYLGNKRIGSLIIFSALFSIIAIPIVIAIHPAVLAISPWQAGLLIVIGALVVISILCYLHALSDDEATLVVPIYQTVPVFTFVLAHFILGETISNSQIVGGLVIILGSLILSLDTTNARLKLKNKMLFLMLLASFFYATSDVLYKLVALERGFWTSSFWTLIGKVTLGLIFLIIVPGYRNQFILVLQNAGKRVISINSLNETLSIIADLVIQYASLLVPIVLVSLANVFQAVFVFLIGILLTMIWPGIITETLTKKSIIQKTLGIAAMVAGVFLLS